MALEQPAKLRHPSGHPTVTKEKAQAINQDLNVYGSFAEIGAGQEVARWFFRVGGASATVAKTISAYDMVVSDQIYGAEDTKRYVCESRLNKMLNREYRLMVERLTATRPTTRFFAFADTVAAKSSKVNQNCHGWLGVRFQTRAGGEPNDLIVHVRMLDSRNYLQQEALGILGVNMVYGATYMLDTPTELLASLSDGLESNRLEIDFVKFVGPDTAHIDNRLMVFHLVESGMTDAVVFSPKAGLEQATAALYNRDVLIQRGNFRPANKLNLNMLESSASRFAEEFKLNKATLMVLPELNILRFAKGGKVDAADFLARIDILSSLGYPVLISKYKHYHELRQFINRCSARKLSLIMSANHLSEIFDESAFDDVPGGLLEALGRLFRGDVKLYVYPSAGDNELFTADNFKPAPHLVHLYDYFCENNKVEALKNFDKQLVTLNSRQIYESVRLRKGNWKEFLPATVADLIEKRQLFTEV
jgi:hypothetical protein